MSLKPNVESRHSLVTPNVHRLWFLALVILGFAVYAPGLTIAYYGDDFESIHTDWHRTSFFRPAQFFLLKAMQTFFGFDTFPIHVTQLLLHVILSHLVYRAAMEFGFGIGQALLASTLMLVSQANVYGVLSNATLSQVGGTCFGYFSLWFNRRGLLEQRAAYHLLGLGSFAMALLFKETSVAFFPMVAVTMVVLTWSSKGIERAHLIRGVVLYLGSYAMVLILYLTLRHAAGAIPIKIGTGSRYEFSLGLNILKNAALLMLSATTPISSVAVYRLSADRRLLPLFAVLFVTCVLAILVMIGMIRRNKRLCLMLASLGLLSVAPALPLAHVSELYTYNVMPVVALMVGGGLGALSLNRWHRIRLVSVSLILAVLVSHVVGLRHKAHLMWENGQRANELLDQVVAQARVAPPGATLRLESGSNHLRYSVFVMPEFSVLRYSTHVIQARAQRSDIRVEFSKSPASFETHTAETILRLKLQDGRVTTVGPNDR